METLDFFKTLKKNVPDLLDTLEKEMEWYENTTDADIDECAKNLTPFMACIYGSNDIHELLHSYMDDLLHK